MDKFRPMPEMASMKRIELGIPNNAFHIVTAAELNKNKNQKIIIEAIAVENKKIYIILYAEMDQMKMNYEN